MSRLVGILIVASFTIVASAAAVNPQETMTASRVAAPAAPSTNPRHPVDNVAAIAVYPYTKEAGLLKRPENWNQIDFSKIRERDDIELILGSLGNEQKDGSRLLMAPNAYVFFLDSSGKQVKYGKVVGGWQYLLLDEDWKKLYPIPERGSQLLRHKRCKGKHLENSKR